MCYGRDDSDAAVRGTGLRMGMPMGASGRRREIEAKGMAHHARTLSFCISDSSLIGFAATIRRGEGT